MSPVATSLGHLVERLSKLDPGFRPGDVAEILGHANVADGELERYLDFRDDRYTRNLVHRGPLFDVIILCWKPGQRTPVHDHSGQRGWVRVLRGCIEETAYAPADPRTAAMAVELGFRADTEVALAETGRGVIAAGPDVAAVDRERAIHRIANPEPASGESAVTLHLYSRPHDCCTVFDLETDRTARRQLSFDSGAR